MLILLFPHQLVELLREFFLFGDLFGCLVIKRETLDL
jgi:hypothetical protein